MILVDTSVWVDHLRRGNARLAGLLGDGVVVSHPFVLGEIACGSLRQRGRILSLLAELPVAATATHSEVLAFIEARHLMGRGLGYVDVHLLAAASIEGVPLWTFDKRLDAAARAMGVAP
ncbi:MAG TPA: type II toxin-antitoxin system VapC family toxin [Gemmatimonadaceae bacterium]